MSRSHPVALARRWLLAAWAFTLATAAHAFGFEDVSARARDLATRPYAPPPVTNQTALLGLTYDEYRDIRFRPSQALWRDQGLPFELQFFHVGRNFMRPLELHEVVDGEVRPLTVPSEAFDYGKADGAARKVELAGFRVHYPINRHDTKDEVIAFLGASYFRAVGANLGYGLSARGIAVDTVGGQGEEFPAFEAFWIDKPRPNATALVIHALLNGPRVTGAYQFVVRPGAGTAVEVRARIYLREPVATLGVAPLTSMFLSGENQPLPGDFRPEVHDSDGLQIATPDGEWLWRPLLNPKGVFATSFSLKGLRGFGLRQRDRRFESYEDTEARYDRRPSVWIEPLGEWGPGRVELMQFHTPDETNDNVVTYWVPNRLLARGQPLDIAWRMHWEGDVERVPGARVVQTRAGRSYEALGPGEFQYVIDFAGGALSTLSDEDPVKAVASAGTNARIIETNVFRHPVTGGWRMTLKLRRDDPTQAVELRAFLRLGSKVLSETWSYAIPPQ